METAPTDPIPHLSNPLFLNHFSQKELILVTSALVLGLLLAVALGSFRTVVVAAVMLLFVLFPALITIIVPALASGVYCMFTGP